MTFTYGAISDVLSPEYTIGKLQHAGLSAEIDHNGVIRAWCTCGVRVAVINTALRPVSKREAHRIVQHLTGCPCMRRQRAD